jgi:hypothetical protein
MKYIKESELIGTIKTLTGLKNSFTLKRPDDTFMKAFLMKRMPFQYEDEVRILIKSNASNKGIKKYKSTIKNIVMEIRLDPRMNKPEELAMKFYIKTFSIKVTKSQLFTDKKIVIT